MTCECGSTEVHQAPPVRRGAVLRTHFHCDACASDWFEDTDGYAWPPDEDRVVMS